jgi:hypothetical protein
MNALVGQTPGNNKPIAAIVAFAANNSHTGFNHTAKLIQQYTRGTPAGIFHKRQTRNAVGFDRLTIHFLHFSGGNQNHLRLQIEKQYATEL